MDGDGENKIDDKSSSTNAEVPLPMETSEQPLLGSVTTFSNTEGSEPKVQQIRSSARVFKKMKLDLSTPLVIEKSEKKEESKRDTKRCYRPLWTSDDKTIFFEALCEFGKDFESIQMYISNKLRKRGVSDHLIKTKDQVRHLYHRSWNKISKYLKFPEGIKKVVQELYGLINYGELRKKIGSVSEKSLQKLNELIYNGSTMVRIKGKTVRVKTPMCKALRRLNQLDEKYDGIRLPNRVTVELQPKDMLSYLRVQNTAQNPRLRTTLPLQTRLSSLLACINKKWKTVEARMYDKALISSSPITDTCLPATKISEANKMLLNPALRVTPPKDCRIDIPSINLSEYFTTQSICLNSYENRIGITNTFCGTFYNYNTFKLINKSNSKKNNRPRTGSISDKSQKNNLHTEDNDNCDITDNEPISDINKVAVEAPKQENHPVAEYNVTVKLKNSEEVQNEMNKQKQVRIATIRKGWTEKDSESLTLGEIYLMFGANSKVTLEYSWDSPVEINRLEKGSNIDSVDDKFNVITNIKEEKPVISKNLDLSDSLAKLLSVAKLYYRKNVIKCTCGHVCGTKNNAQLKRAVESKIRKILTDIDKCSDEVEQKMTSEGNMFQNDRFLKPPVYLKPKIHPISPSYFHHTNPSHLVSQIDSIQRLKPRYCNRRGRRPRSKQVVVERKLPLLPNKVESGHQIVRMNIISQEDSKESNIEQDVFDQSDATSGGDCNVFQNQQLSTTNPLFLQENDCTTFNFISESMIKTEIMELANENTIVSQPSSSPSRILKAENDNQWISSEVADYSLSSLLGHLESPMKACASSSNLTSEYSHLSQDVDAQLSSLLTQTSVDFSANFADLAAQVTKEIKK